MASLDFGTVKQFDSSEAGYNSICRLDDTHFAIAFKDVTDSNKGKVVIGTLSGTTITITDDSATTFEDGQIYHCNIQIKALDSTHFVIVYADASDSNYGKAIIGSVSGTTITLGSIVTLAEVAVATCGCTALNSEYFVAIFAKYDSPYEVLAYVCSVSGITITTGSVQTLLDTGITRNLSSSRAVALDNSSFVFLYALVTTGYLGVACVTVDKGNKTTSLESQVSTGIAGTLQSTIDNFDSRYFIIGNVYAITIGEVEGTTVSVGSNTTLEANAKKTAVCATDSTHWAAAYFDDADSDKGKIQVGLHSAKAITVDSGIGIVEFEADDTDDLAICRMANDYFVIAFKHA